MKTPKAVLVYRIIDANINRAKEGLRVCEEIARFVLESRSLTESFKKARHEISHALGALPDKAELVKLRDSLKDVGFGIKQAKEFQRRGCKDIFIANISRVKESLRVLEEFSKLLDVKAAARFKKARYRIYDLEKKIIGKISTLDQSYE